MNTTLHRKYANLSFDKQQVNMFSEMLIGQDKMYEVIELIIMYTKRNKESVHDGITVSEILKKLDLADKDRYQIQNYVSQLKGGTLIRESQNKEFRNRKLFSITIRGAQVYKEMNSRITYKNN